MASSNTDSPGTIYRWIEKKPLTEAVTWTSREKFWLITATCHYGTHDWKSVAQVVRNSGEPYRPQEWYTPKSCERQFKILVSNLSKEAKSLPFIDMLRHIAEGLKNDYIREAHKSNDTLKSKYCSLFSILNRVKQGNLSRNEVVSLYSQARRNEIEGKQYMDQLMTRQNASLASESSSGLTEEQPIKWNTPSAPLLTSLLRSRNTIPANRTATTIASLLQSPSGTSRTRSGKLLPLTTSIRTTQGTPTLSKLLEAPANPYISSPTPSTQKNKLSEVGTEKLANTSRKENSQSTSLNRVRVDNMTTLGSLNQINKSDLSASKRQISKSPVSAVKNGPKANSCFVDLLSDDSEEETKNASLKSLPGDKKDTSSRLEPRATRSQTRAEGGFKQMNDTKLSDGKKERESLRSDISQVNESHLIVDLIDIDQIDVEPLSTGQDEIQTPSKMTRSSLQRLRLSSSGDNLLTNKKVNSKEISNQMLEDISADFVLNSTSNTLAPEYKCLLGLPNDSDNTTECLIPIDRRLCKDAILIRKDSQSLQNTLSTNDNKLLNQRGVFGVKSANVQCFDNINDPTLLSYNNQPIVVVNKIQKPFNIQFPPEQRNKTNNIQVSNTDVKKTNRFNNSSQNVVKPIDSSSDEVIIIDDDININEDNMTPMKTKELSNNAEIRILPSTLSCIPKSTTVIQLDEKKYINDKTPWNISAKTQNISDTTKKQIHQDSVAKSRSNSNINESNNRFIKELDFDFDQSISQTSLSELYSGVEEIVEMHSFDNEELNSLIECGSLDSNETEERIDIVSVDQGDSSVSESDSSIGVFDTFAQITGVRKKSSTSKDMKFDTIESKHKNCEVRHLKESFCQSEEIYDDQTSTSSVTGIPILQGVISDVMSQINSDSVVSHTNNSPHNLLITDIVEISSDEEFIVDIPKKHASNLMQTQTKKKETESYKLKGDELIKIHEVEPKMYKGVNMIRGTSIIKPIHIEMPPCIIVKNFPSDTDRARNQILTINKGFDQEYDDQDFDITFVSNSDNIREENELNEVEVIQPQELTIKIANEKLMKETERMKKEAKEREEKKKKEEDDRKKKEYERKMQEDNERKKKEYERKKQEDNERKKKECERKKQEDIEKKKKEYERKKQEDIERKKKEYERKKQEDIERKKKEYERKKQEEIERMKKENEERKKKEEEERKKKEEDKKKRELEKKLKFELNEKKKREEEERKIREDNERKKEEDERIKKLEFDEAVKQQRIALQSKLTEYSNTVSETMKSYNSQDILARVVVKEEIIEDVDDFYRELMHEEISSQEILNEEIINEQIINEQIINEQIINEEIINEELINEEIFIRKTLREEIMEEDTDDEEIEDEEIEDEEIEDEEIEDEEIEDEEIEDEEIEDEEIEDEEIGVEEIGVEEIGVEEIGVEEIGVEEIGDEEIGDEEIGDEEIEDEEIEDQETEDEETEDEETEDEETEDEEIEDEEIEDEEIINEQITNAEITNDEIINEEIITEHFIEDDSCIDNEYNDEVTKRNRMLYVNQIPSYMECISKSPTELTQLRDCELQLIEESFKSEKKLTKCKNNEDLRNNKEIKLTAGDVQVQIGFIGFQRQTNEEQYKQTDNFEIQRFKEAAVQKSKEVEKQRAKEIICRKDNEVEINRVKASVMLERIKIDSVKIAEEVETKKSKEVKSRKIISVEDTDMKELNNRCTLKKVKEPVNNQSVGHTEVNLAMHYKVSPVHFKKRTEHLENDTNIEQGLIESRKAATKDDFETFNLREKGIKTCMKSEEKSSKGIEIKSNEVKMITRKRRLKAEEKLKETNVSRYVSTKLRPQIKFSGSPSSSASSTIVENPLIPSFEHKKQTKNTDDYRSQNSTSNLLYDNRNNRDLNIDSSVIVRKENLNSEVIGIPSTRTRSSSFKQRTISSKQDQDDGADIIPKEIAKTKTKVSISTHSEHQTTRAKSPPKTIFNKHTFNDNNGGKTLIIPVVMLNTNEIPLHKIHQRSVNNFGKQQEIKPSHDQIETAAKLDKPPPKKRGRKRRIEELQESNSSNKTAPQNVAKQNTLKKMLEAPAFRTRRSLGQRGYKNNSTNDSYLNKYTNKRTLRLILNSICEQSKYISSLNKEVTGIAPMYAKVLKCPIDLREIKRKITLGVITNLGELQLSLLMMSFNALMINQSTSIVNSDVLNFQLDLKTSIQGFKGSVHDSANQNVPEESKPNVLDESTYVVQYPSIYKNSNCDSIVVNKKTFPNLAYNYFDDISNNEESDSSNNDTPPPKKKRKNNMSDSSNSESD